MSIMIVAPHTDFWCKSIHKACDSYGVSISSWVGDTSNSNSPLGQGYDIFPAWHAFSLEGYEFQIELNSKSSISARDISSYDLFNYLKILDRVDFNGMMTLSERTCLLDRQLDFWYKYLVDTKIEFVLFSNIPHLPYDYAIYIAAKHLSIPVINANRTPFQGVCYLTEGIGHDPIPISDRIGESPISHSHFIDPFVLAAKTKLWYMEKQEQDQRRSSINIKRIARTIRHPQNFFRTVFLKNRIHSMKFRSIKTYPGRYSVSVRGIIKNMKEVVSAKLRQKTLRSAHDACITKNLPVNYIYFPLNYQPEATTAPFCDFDADQISFIRRIANNLPNDCTLVVKEHPTSFRTRLFGTSGRHPSYWDEIVNIKGVALVSQDIDSKQIIKRSNGVIVLNGPAGWESVVNKIPCLVASRAWFSYCPGVSRIDDSISLREKLKDLFEGRIYCPSDHDIESFKRFVDTIFFQINEFPGSEVDAQCAVSSTAVAIEAGFSHVGYPEKKS